MDTKYISLLGKTCATSEQDPSMAKNEFESVQAYEDLLTPDARLDVTTYFWNCTEKWTGAYILIMMDRSLGQPLSNAFYLHELKEIEECQKMGRDFLNVRNPDEDFRAKRTRFYDENPRPHLEATIFHSSYLQKVAQERGLQLSLAACLEQDPFTQKSDLEQIQEIYPELVATDEENAQAFEYFLELARSEESIFTAAFSLGNSRKYSDVIYREIPIKAELRN